jgi:hypothetical protein
LWKLKIHYRRNNSPLLSKSFIYQPMHNRVALKEY